MGHPVESTIILWCVALGNEPYTIWVKPRTVRDVTLGWESIVRVVIEEGFADGQVMLNLLEEAYKHNPDSVGTSRDYGIVLVPSLIPDEIMAHLTLFYSATRAEGHWD